MELETQCGVVKVSISILNTNNTEYTLDYSVVSKDNSLHVAGDVSMSVLVHDRNE